MEGPVLIGVILVAVIVVVVVAVFVRRAVRSRSARSDWLGELSEIRRSSLGDDEEEVTGVLKVVTVDEETAAPEELEGPEEEGPVTVTDRPTRSGQDAGSPFVEYDWPSFGALRIMGEDRRVLVDHPERTQQLMVDLPRGTLWFRSATQVSPSPCTARIAAAWVKARGDLLIVGDPDDWSYVMCLQGEATIRSAAEGPRTTITQGQIARVRVGVADVDVVDVGGEALESESAVRRQRRLDDRGEGEEVR